MTRFLRFSLPVVLLVSAALLALGSSRRQSASTPPPSNAPPPAAPRVRCSAPPGVYVYSPLGKWVALVKSTQGRITSFGRVMVYRDGPHIRLLGRNYHRNGQLKYEWRGVGTWDGRVFTYVWKIQGRNAGINKMVLTHGNARLDGFWYRKGAKGRETFCRAL